jgi:hypothetical protein
VNALPGLDQNSYATLVAANIAQYCFIPAAVRDKPASPMPAHVTKSPASRTNTGPSSEPRVGINPIANAI